MVINQTEIIKDFIEAVINETTLTEERKLFYKFYESLPKHRARIVKLLETQAAIEKKAKKLKLRSIQHTARKRKRQLIKICDILSNLHTAIVLSSIPIEVANARVKAFKNKYKTNSSG